jgi:tetratricopeptide (TPR) repeat protein
MHGDTLKLIISYRDRAPTAALSRSLGDLFDRLSASGVIEGEMIESAIWDEWMSNNDPFAHQLLITATEAIVMENYEEAEAVLDELVKQKPDFAEAWNKRATLYYLLQRDDESLSDLVHVLSLEPRHFGAMCHFAQICLSKGDTETALYALDTALKLNPHLDEARATARKLLRDNNRRTLQ